MYIDNRHAADADAALSALNADLLVLTEWTGKNAGDLPTMTRIADGHVPRSVDGIGAWARDATFVAEVLPNPVDGPCAMPMVTIRGAGVAFLGLHAPTPRARCDGGNAATLAEIGRWIRDGHLVRDVDPARRGDRVVVLGDLNALSWTPAFRPLRATGLTPVGSWWPRPTFPAVFGLFALGRIDHVLTDLPVVAQGTARVPGSDHHAVWADIVLPPLESSP